MNLGILKRGKKGIELDMLGYWILGIAVLAVIVIGIFVLKGKGAGYLDFIKDLFRFG